MCVELRSKFVPDKTPSLFIYVRHCGPSHLNREILQFFFSSSEVCTLLLCGVVGVGGLGCVCVCVGLVVVGWGLLVGWLVGI